MRVQAKHKTPNDRSTKIRLAQAVHHSQLTSDTPPPALTGGATRQPPHVTGVSQSQADKPPVIMRS